MKINKKWTYAIFVGISEAVGGLSALLTREGMDQVMLLPKSQLTPPPWLFPIVWGILFALMGIGAARVWLTPDSEIRTQGLWLFVFQLIFNFFWSLFYFNMQAFGFSFLWLIALWVLIGLMTVNFRRADNLAGWFQLPYLIWVAFAGYLNYAAWMLNR